MIIRLKNSGISFFKWISSLSLKILRTVLYLLKLRRRSPFSEEEINENLQQPGEMISTEDQQLEKLDKKWKFFKSLLKLFSIVCFAGFLYANFLHKKLGIENPQVDQFEAIEKILSK